MGSVFLRTFLVIVPTHAAPDDFLRLCSMFAHRTGHACSGTDEEVPALIEGLKGYKRVAVRRFPDDLLNGRHSAAEIKGAWNRTPDDVRFTPASDVYGFTVLVRDMLKAEAPRTG